MQRSARQSKIRPPISVPDLAAVVALVVLVDSARRRVALALILAPELACSVQEFRRFREPLEGELSNPHPIVQRHRKVRHVGQLQGEVPPSTQDPT